MSHHCENEEGVDVENGIEWEYGLEIYIGEGVKLSIVGGGYLWFNNWPLIMCLYF